MHAALLFHFEFTRFKEAPVKRMSSFLFFAFVFV